MQSLNKLFAKRDEISAQAAASVGGVDDQIQSILNQCFDDHAALQAAIRDLESFNQAAYMFSEDGGIGAWIRCHALSDIPKRERAYLDNYLSDRSMRADYKNDCLMQWLGDDHYQIQDDGRFKRDNGVWQGHNQIIREDEYTTEDGEVDEEMRNRLIEAHMEKSGVYPGVFRVTQYGDVYPVNTQGK